MDACYPCCDIPIKNSEEQHEGVCDYFDSGVCRSELEIDRFGTIEEYEKLLNERAADIVPFSGCGRPNVFTPMYLHIQPRR